MQYRVLAEKLKEAAASVLPVTAIAELPAEGPLVPESGIFRFCAAPSVP